MTILTLQHPCLSMRQQNHPFRTALLKSPMHILQMPP